ncbi:CRISPR system Cascade subunit CasA [Corynebacterium mycetoides]|uniref:CRISPR system Cascade subunit CasA n=1 Tax=Corynebacterium mycetoides TaxID=38302 RepID=A0A1G9PD05_9CORY|nr:type I-E CRISPR-associated protein Cse1/CasA [Corynebacterium mycetoides]SDL96604.1 CRISPR system Cascade subunit CasA [Corynebacterium mycetoides]
MNSPAFNLLDEPWIIIHDQSGTQHNVGMRQLFDGSARAADIVGDSPTQDYAVLRVLLAVFWRAHYLQLASQLQTRKELDAFDWEDWFTQQRKGYAENFRDSVVLAYLEKWEHRFNLLDPQQPFMQVADLQTGKDTRLPISRIVPEAEHDYFTMRTGSGRASLSFAEAARWLIHTHAYDYSGIKPGAVGDERVKGGKGYPIGTGWTGMTGGTVIRRDSLLETLLFNTTPGVVLGSLEDGGNSKDDLPVWEREPDTAAQRKDPIPRGAIDMATWQSRRIRLYSDGERITEVMVTNGDAIPDAGKNIFHDPMTPYRFSQNQSKKGVEAYYPRPYDLKRTMWRSLDPLVAIESDPGFDAKNRAPKRPQTLEHVGSLSRGAIGEDVLNLTIVSMGYGPQASSVGATLGADVALPAIMLEDNDLATQARVVARAAASAATNAAVSIGWFAGQLLVAAGGDYEFAADAADRFLALLEPRFYEWLKNFDVDDIDESAEQWQRFVALTAVSEADELVAGAGPKALAGRMVPPRNEGESGFILSAGGLRDALTRRLRKDLPLAHPQPETSKKG